MSIFAGALKKFKYAIPKFSFFRSGSSVFDKSRIIPDMISRNPPEILKVTYLECNSVLIPGQTLRPRNVMREPRVEWKCQKDFFYTLMLLDPDAPTRKKPSMRCWNHWLVGNIEKNYVERAKHIVEYVGAAPPMGTGDHRYVFLVYRQDKAYSFKGENEISDHSAEGRNNFSLQNFVTKYSLVGPVAANFFYAHYDKSVILTYRKLGLS